MLDWKLTELLPAPNSTKHRSVKGTFPIHSMHSAWIGTQRQDGLKWVGMNARPRGFLRKVQGWVIREVGSC